MPFSEAAETAEEVTVFFLPHNFSLPLFAHTFKFTSIALVSQCKYLFKLVRGSIL